MATKNFENYILNMNKTLNDKLFFLDKIDLNDKIIIDFGCGDGCVTRGLLQKYKPAEIYFVDNNPRMLEVVKKNNTFKKVHYLNGFNELKKVKFDKRKDVVMLLTSVLHEVSFDIQKQIISFIRNNCKYFIIRDMRLVTYTKPSLNMSNTDLAKIIANSNTKLLCDFINHYGYSKPDMLHYLLKYTYVENWSNEVLEDYTSVRWELFLEDVMRDCGLSTRIKGIYCNSYIQEWRRNKVLEDFDIDLAKLYKCTHCDFIGEVVKLN